jgi:hypothetical protein
MNPRPMKPSVQRRIRAPRGDDVALETSPRVLDSLQDLRKRVEPLGDVGQRLGGGVGARAVEERAERFLGPEVRTQAREEVARGWRELLGASVVGRPAAELCGAGLGERSALRRIAGRDARSDQRGRLV